MKEAPALLIVDDNPADVGLAREALIRCAHRGPVDSAGDGVVGMKADPELRRIPVVIFSTSKLGRDIARSYELGANCYVSKPGNLHEYFSVIKSIEEFWFGPVSLPSRGE
jgi:DNA-binding NarL/FixJ family response regulator